MDNMTAFFRNLLRLCAETNETPSGVASSIGLSAAAASGWKKGKIPSDVNMSKIASHFGVTISDLMGWSPESMMRDTGEKIALIKQRLDGDISDEDREELRNSLYILEESYDDISIARHLIGCKTDEKSPADPMIDEAFEKSFEEYLATVTDREELLRIMELTLKRQRELNGE